MLTGERGEQTCGRIADEERDSLLQNGESVSTLLSAELDSYLVQVRVLHQLLLLDAARHHWHFSAPCACTHAVHARMQCFFLSVFSF